MVIASIDLASGKAVQLERGAKKILEWDNPEELAENFSRYGEIAVIDLDAAMGCGDNHALVRNICRRGGCRVGGGIRTVRFAEELLSWGAEKIIIGTRAFNGQEVNRSFLGRLVRSVGRERIMIALDFKAGEVVREGWTRSTGVPLEKCLAWFEPYAGGYLITAVEREGMMGGADWNTLERVIGTASLPVTYAGGVASLDEVRRLSAMGADIQVGMALYTGKIGLAEAFVASLNWRGESLIPVVTTDGVGRVLMMAYASKESIMRSFLTGYMWYFSRSRQRLWQKGESSGNVQKLIQLRADCDRDTVRAMVDPQGPSCHLGHDTCFGSLGFTLEQLQRVVEKRLAQPDSRSYTASLNRSEVRNKLMEEAGEVVEATDRDEVIWEAADLLYFLTVLISKEGIEYGEVWNELWRRRWLKGSAGGVNGKGEKDETNRQR